MSKFFSRTIDDGQFVFHHDERGGNGVLLILTTGSSENNAPLSPYGEDLLSHALTKIVPILGAWKRIVVATASASISAIVEKHDPDHVMLMASQRSLADMASVLENAAGLRKGTNLTGILVKHEGRRWIATPPLSAYGYGDDRSGVAASLMGHLYRHLELLRIGLIGWKNVRDPVSCKLVETREDWEALRQRLATRKIVAIDTETNNLERINNTILTLQFGFDGLRGWVLPIDHRDSRLPRDVLDDALDWLQKYFERGKCATHVYANAAFDLHQLHSLLGLRWYNHDVYDVQGGQFNLDEMHQGRKRLGFAKGEYWGLERLCLEAGMNHYQHSEIGKGDRARLATVPLDLVAKYGAIDVALPIRLMMMQRTLARWRTKRMQGQPYKDFYKAVTQVEGMKIQQFCAMERNGLLVDRKYVVSLQGPDSPVLSEIRKSEAAFSKLPAVLEANRKLLASRNVRARTLFGGKGTIATAFDAGKPAHQQLLFFDVMKLKPVKNRQDGSGSVDDKFKQKYKDNPVVKAFADLEEAKKLNSTFIAGYYKLLTRNLDNSDGRLRPKYGYLNVKTGRSSSTDPNLQNIPSRNEVRAKIIKRQFVSRRGRLFLKDDMSAHEVRMWGIISKDKKVCESFWKGMQIRLRYEMQRHIPEDKKGWWGSQLDAADVHRQNYERLFKVPAVQVNKQQRNSVKTTIFGSIYGYSMSTLGNVLQANKADGLKKEIKELKAKAENDNAAAKKLADLEKELEQVLKQDWTPEAKRTYKLIFKDTFATGGKWLEMIPERAKEHLIATNLIGGVRHLWGYLHIERSVHSAMSRRGPNSVIQGPASNLGYRASYETRRVVWECFTSKGVDIDYVQCNAVHDSSEAECSIVNIPLMAYIRAHSCTTLLHRHLRDTFGFEPLVGFEMDAEVGPSLASLKKATRWDFTVDAIEHGIKWGNENLGWELDVDAYMKIVRHNANIMFDIRSAEIKRQLERGERTNYHMFLTPANSLKLGLKFYPPREEKRAVVRKAGPSRSLLKELA